MTSAGNEEHADQADPAEQTDQAEQPYGFPMSESRGQTVVHVPREQVADGAANVKVLVLRILGEDGQGQDYKEYESLCQMTKHNVLLRWRDAASCVLTRNF